MKMAGLLIQVCISFPIWFFLIYKILESIQASELIWFLFWVYVPITVVGALIAKLVEDDKKT